MQITGGYLKSRKIESPKGSNVRPTLSQVRESIFSMLFSLIDFDGKIFLDAFAGSGIMGFEAISRGFDSITFIEKDKKTYFQLKKNSEILNINPNLILGDTLKVLKKSDETFDVIYIDPPYMSGLYDNVLSIICENNLLKKDGLIVLEHPKSLEINFRNYEIIKQKNYADKTITVLKFTL